ncbi:MAG: GNAT family N-acetyltransferase [Patescibacteria group bacterium UBA2163]
MSSEKFTSAAESSMPRLWTKYEAPEKRIELIVKGECVGYAILISHQEPFRFYYVDEVFVDKKERGKSYGSKLVRKINSFLGRKNAAGILMNAIHPDDPTYNLYSNYGWQEVPEFHGYYMYGRKNHHTGKKVCEAINNI